MNILETTKQTRQWRRWCRRAGVDNLYYRLDYLRIWQREEGGHPVGVRFQCDDGTVLYPVLRVPLDELDGGDGLVDVRTAYDFGGPLPVGPDRTRLLERFDHHWRQLLAEWNAVTEFARLHPLRLDVVPEDAIFHDDIYVVDLRSDYRDIRGSYRDSFSGQLAQAEQNDLIVDIADRPSRYYKSIFSRLYEATMTRVGADPFYFFSPRTLYELMDLPESTLVTTLDEDRPVAMALVLHSGDDSYYFLAASRQSALDLRPNNILIDRMIQNALDRNRRYLHLGGGNQGVRHFKSQPANATFPYHLLKRIHRPDDYRRLCEAMDVDTDGIFPAYRPELLRRKRESPISETTEQTAPHFPSPGTGSPRSR